MAAVTITLVLTAADHGLVLSGLDTLIGRLSGDRVPGPALRRDLENLRRVRELIIAVGAGRPLTLALDDHGLVLAGLDTLRDGLVPGGGSPPADVAEDVGTIDTLIWSLGRLLSEDVTAQTSGLVS